MATSTYGEVVVQWESYNKEDEFDVMIEPAIATSESLNVTGLLFFSKTYLSLNSD